MLMVLGKYLYKNIGRLLTGIQSTIELDNYEINVLI